jgi:hypothetical protein
MFFHAVILSEAKDLTLGPGSRELEHAVIALIVRSLAVSAARHDKMGDIAHKF